ncbi:hypothetical protein CHLRE_11g467654v5 [Chlamydomonas reinhardtii]|uniref:RNA helicase n=1 Tax=Chlamydomonas reinhardtii TaxID=3055 RepID=A0A2K3D7K0_CHLRE|nr:uncharacterized protein CHLRE_11g467654v5 [Chlamydomonas reinhardtii]PNW76512.1 hypothetical protein CHLRE_11g467654v5 [Chlamydomonas reinhardtii]
MDPPGGGFIRPGTQSGSAFGLKFDRPPPQQPSWRDSRGGRSGGGGPASTSGRRSAADVFGAGGRGRGRGRGQDRGSQGQDRGTASAPASDEDDDAEWGPGQGPRGPDLPPMNPTYRYGDPSLPVSKYRRQILWLVENHAVTIIVGETGSGKTTQVPQFLLEAGWAESGYAIACTQPRRVAASTVAARVAEEMGVELGTAVGYAVRFDNAISERTRIKYLTDGVLLREMMDDPLLTQYSVIMVDEAHERSLATDMLLGLLKKVLKRRPDLRLIISSATLEAGKLRDFFDTSTSASTARRRAALAAAAAAAGAGVGGVGCSEPDRTPAVVTVEGRTHPVQVHYLQQPAADYVAAAVSAAVDIHCEDLPGDILIFLTGQEEVQAAVAQLEEQSRRLAGGRVSYSLRMMPLPLYAGLPGAAQSAVFRPAPRGVRKVVAATNIAETSLTLEGVVYVVDCCFVKQRAYNPLTGLESLLVAPLSQASAAQRAGRAGRVRAGHCFRLCREEDFAQLPKVTVPEMQRSNLVSMVLQLKSLGIDNVMRFEWLAPPPAEAMVRALEELHALRVLDDDARLTKDVGLALAALPLEPSLGAALLAARRLGCVEELLTVAALMSVPHVWAPAAGALRAADEAKAKFAAAEGDGVTMLNVHRAWRSSGRSSAWAGRHFLNASSLYRADEARDQLLGLLRRHGLLDANTPPPSCGADMEPVCRALAAGQFMCAAVYEGTQYNPLAAESDPGVHVYRLVRYTAHKTAPLKLRIHNSSVLWRSAPPCVVYRSVQQADSGWYEMQQADSGLYEMQGLTAVQPDWLVELAPHMFHRPK